MTSYSTIKLSDHPFGRELAAPCKSAAAYFANVLASAAFTILQGDDVFGRGSVLLNLARQHYPASNLPHLYLAAPSLGRKHLHCSTAAPSRSVGSSPSRFPNRNTPICKRMTRRRSIACSK